MAERKVQLWGGGGGGGGGGGMQAGYCRQQTKIGTCIIVYLQC